MPQGPSQDATIISDKVHIRGLDTFSTSDVRSLVEEHHGRVSRVEWIDDESANLLFLSPVEAQDALLALSSFPIDDITALVPTETIPAKALASKPEANLRIRFALTSDKKLPGAAARSRYYLFHPDQDPEERRRQERNRYRVRDRDESRYDSNYRNRMRDSEQQGAFDASLYDDDEAALALRATKSRKERRSRSPSTGSGQGHRPSSHNEMKELFPTRKPLVARALGRDRSISPVRDGSRAEGWNEKRRDPGTVKNRTAATDLKHRMSRENRSKELFPVRATGGSESIFDKSTEVEETTKMMSAEMSIRDDEGVSGSGAPEDSISIRGIASRTGREGGFSIKGAAGAKVTELFPGKFGGNQSKELFLDKLEGRGRPRRRAEDLFS